MTKVSEIFRFLDNIAPTTNKMDGDNVGLLVGHADAEVSKVLVALDVLPETILEAERVGAQLIVAHHPVIFRPAASVTDCDTTGLRVLMLAERKLAAICMHTNLDAALVNDKLAEALGLSGIAILPNSDGICRFGSVEPQCVTQFVDAVRDTLHAGGVAYYDAGREVTRVAIGGGACGDYIAAAADAGCDTLVVGEAKYHEYLDARILGINLVVAGHFPTEDIVCPALVDLLHERFPSLEVVKSEEQRDIVQWR